MLGYLAAGCAVAIWGIEYVIIKAAAPQAGPYVLGLIVFGMAAIGLAGICRVQSARSKAPAPEIGLKEKFGLIAPVVVVGATLNPLWVIGTGLTTAGSAAILGRSDVLFAFLLSFFVARSEMRKSAFLYAPLMLAGVALTTGVSADDAGVKNYGDVMLLIVAFFIAVNSFLIKRATMRGVTGHLLAAWNSFGCAIAFGVALWFSDMDMAQFSAISPKIWIAMLAMGASGPLFFVAYYYSLQVLPVWEVRLLCLGIPVVAILVGWATLGEKPAGTELLGMTLICAGAAGLILSRRTEPAAESA